MSDHSSIENTSRESRPTSSALSFEETQASFISQTQPNTRSLFAWGVLVLSVFIIVIVVISTIFQHTLRDRVEQVVLSVPSASLEAEKQKQLELLNSYGLVPGETDIVHIPIQEAMQKEVRSREKTSP